MGLKGGLMTNESLSASIPDGAHSQKVFLLDGLQHLCLHSLGDESQLLGKCLIAIGYPDVWHIGTTDVIAF